MTDDAPLSEDNKRAVVEALTALLADARFRASDRNRRFLAFVVENALAGQSERIKGYSIAVDVFGREPSFDSAIDPIVRIEAGRLRAALTQYYDKYGQDLSVRIDIPKGAYRPSFSFATAARTQTPPAEVAPASAPGTARLGLFSSLKNALRGIGQKRLGFGFAILLLSSVIGIAGAAGLGLWAGSAARTAGPAVLVVGAVTALDDDRTTLTHARTLTKSLAVALGQLHGLTVVTQPPNRDIDEVLTAEMNAHRGTSVYVLRVAVRRDGRLLYYATLGNARTAETVWSENRDAPVTTERQVLAEDLIARRVAAVVGSAPGVVPTLERRRSAGAAETGYGCIQFAVTAVQATPAQMSAARDCLERTVARTPTAADAWALLAQARAWLSIRGSEEPHSAEAVHAASARAIALAPLSALTQAGVIAAAIVSGDDVGAARAAERLADMSPADPQHIGLAAMTLWRLGDHARARALIEQAQSVFADGLALDSTVLLLEAYREQRFADAAREAAALMSEDPVVRAVEAAVAHRTGDAARAEAALRALAEVLPRLEDLPRLLRSQRFRPAFIEQLLQDLRPMQLTRR